MRLVAISDTHGKHAYLPEIPNGDVLIHAGDFMRGPFNKYDYYDFIEWMAEQSHYYKLVVPGNHDGILDKKAVDFEIDKLIHYAWSLGVDVLTEGVTCVEGKLFGFFSYTPNFRDWYFMDSEKGLKMRLDYMKKQLNDETLDVFISHGPSFGVCDVNNMSAHCGSKSLDAFVKDVQPVVHIHGHIHESYGQGKNGDTDVYCVSSLDDRYQVANNPVVIDIPDFEVL